MNWDHFFFYVQGEIYWKERPRSDFVSRKSWLVTTKNFAGKRAGSVVKSPRSATSYRQAMISGKQYKCHRIIWEMHNGPIPAGLSIDHIDGNGLNNRIQNLRVVSRVEQMHNLPMQKSNTSEVVGVCWHKSAQAWQARISMAGDRVDLGRFKNKDDAVSARKAAEIKLGYHENHGRRAS
jgi:hypothetical protein